MDWPLMRESALLKKAVRGPTILIVKSSNLY